MVRIILLGIGIVAAILFVAWILRDPIYVMIENCDPSHQNDRADMSGMCVLPGWIIRKE